ncbi:hypothetical protein HG535_0F05350 [Zygotorulaspora mrakii]|uniref:DSC E3 ubiquitin ligase complex subunit 3 C-terminal domain-containing protein n=1 Tax=Zygotorulaspora mrakii TaxID=42260 RepID=A0A7H9B691_ZYGMR|nr:uncharacterized protein HG535_0F05350 [Zygotorulaspora mrakii]QLG74023.1 hypothetical protein HG535_0F05350 [Zygotorulaspora mrakii]
MSEEPLLPLYNDSSLRRYIVIRFSDVGIRDLDIDVTNIPYSDINTQWLRRKCRALHPEETSNRRLKFIRSGAMLKSHSDLSREMNRYFIQHRDQQDSNRFYIHCIVGSETLSNEQLTNEDALDDVSPSNEGTTTQAIGFDRLRAVGFSEQEIELLRQQFRHTYGDLEEEASRHNGNEDGSTDIRQLEEQWMETGVDDGSGRALDDNRFNSIAVANFKHNKDLLIGICIGFVFGIFGLLLMKLDGLFNKRQKMSIVAGVIVNIMFNLFRGF